MDINTQDRLSSSSASAPSYNSAQSTRDNSPDIASPLTSQKQADQLKSKWRLGLLLLSVVIVLWVASGFLVNVC